jgi:membrane associated rhomboid family serine protease
MFSLYFIGSFVESIIGRKRFVIFYIISGIIGGIFFVLLAGFFGTGAGAIVFGSPDIRGVGASGAIFGLLGLLAVITPRNRVYLIVGPLIAIIIQAILGNFNMTLYSILGFIVNIYFIVSIIAILSFSSRTRRIALPLEMPFWILPIFAIIPLVIIGLFVPLPIGNTAHFGGLIAGLVYGLYLRRKYPKKIAFLSRIFR